MFDLLVQLVRCISGLADDFCEEFGKVGEIFFQESRSDYQVLSGVECTEFTTKQFGLAGNSKGRSFQC